MRKKVVFFFSINDVKTGLGGKDVYFSYPDENTFFFFFRLKLLNLMRFMLKTGQNICKINRTQDISSKYKSSSQPLRTLDIRLDIFNAKY